MAFLMSSSTSSNVESVSTPSTSVPTTLAELQRTASTNELLAGLDSQLLMQQNVAQTLAAQSSVGNDALGTQQLYQQLLAQMQQQQSSQPPSLPISPPVQANVQPNPNDLIQQLASSLLVNPSLASSIQPQLASLAAAQQQQAASQSSSAFNATNPSLAALSSLINASPSLLPSLIQANGQPAQSTASSMNPMDSLTSQLLMGGGGNQSNLLAVLNLLQTNPLLASQLLLQQQQQQQSIQSNPNLALFAQLVNNSNAAANRVSDINQLAALLQQAQVPSQGVPSQGEQTPKLYGNLLQQKQQQDSHQALVSAVAAAAARQLPGRLSTQNSSNSLLSGLTNSGFDSPTSTTLPSHPAGTSSQSSIPDAAAMMSGQVGGGNVPPLMQSASRQASSDRLLNSAESVQDHISRLISENEAIIEPNPVLLKRRPYHRQSTSNSITSQTSEIAGSSQQNSPSLFHQVPNNRLPTTRSQSMHESQMSLHCGSLTSGQPIVRNTYQQPAPASGQQPNNLACTFCGVKFPNDAGLRVHEVRCSSKKEQLTKKLLKHMSQPQLLLQNQLQNYQLQQQQKLLAQKQHQTNIAALVGGGAGVAPDPLVLNGSSSGRSSVPIGTGTTTARPPGVQASPPIQTSRNAGSPSTSSTGSENRHPLKKRLLESVAKNSSDAGGPQSTTSSPTSVTPSASTTNSSSMPNIDMHEAQNSPAKIAKLDDRSLNESRQLAEQLLNAQRELLNGDSNAHTLLQQLIKQILYAPIVSEKCPKQMRDWILFCTSYAKAEISIKMPYILTLDKRIGDLYQKHHEFVTPALLITRGRARNVTVELNTTHKSVPNSRVMSRGQSQYISYPKQQAIVSTDDEMHLLLSLRNSSRPIQFPSYTTPNDGFRNRTTHSEYWTSSSAKDRILAVSSGDSNVIESPQRAEVKLESIPETTPEPTPMETTPEPKIELPDKEPDTRLTEAVTKRPTKINLKSNNKERTEEFEVYVRGRGRGRYVCEQCGIKCKKPSMLKKHLNVHTDIRLFKCLTCNFAFKTKGNLTKHLLNSKTHRIKVANSRCSVEVPKTSADGKESQVITTEAEIDNAIQREVKFIDDGFDNRHDEEDNESDNELDTEHEHHQEPLAKTWRFGQENILWQRSAHTPPTLWMLCEEEKLSIQEEKPTSYWPPTSETRSCHSAPPLALCSPTPGRNRQSSNLNAQGLASASSSLGFNVEMSPSAIGDCGETSLNNELLTNYIPMLKSNDGSSTTSNDLDFNSLFNTDSQELQCEQCDKKFRKPSDLHLHRQTHLIEQQQNSRARTYQCPECKVVHRSRAHLEKHMIEQHESLAISEDHSPTTFPNELDNGASSSTDLQPPGQQNMRRYWCSDCNIGFRTHGVLAKHLRTKNHVKSLVQQGKLPDDALNLVKDNTGHLLEVDTNNCEQARLSLLKILDRLRSSQPDSKNGSLECSERLTSSPPTELAIGISQKHATIFQPQQKLTSITGHKRKNSERHTDGESASQRPRSNSCMIGISSSAQRRLIGNEVKSGASTPGSTIAYRLSANGRPLNPFTQQNSGNTTAIFNATVWTPPLVDQLVVDEKHHHHLEHGAESVASSAREEVMSESTGRSESSTPVQRQNNHHNTNLASPIPMTTVCTLCDVNFDSPAALQVHYNSEHISFHDGNDFKCPRRNCDKIFPNRVSLRNHITAHFFGGGANPHDNSTSLMSPTDVEPINVSKANVHNGIQATNHSPSAPESTHTVVSDISENKSAERAKNEDQSKAALACSLCSQGFGDAQQLQSHWITEHLSQLNNRTHICSHCDAGFTSSDSLRAHSEKCSQK